MKFALAAFAFAAVASAQKWNKNGGYPHRGWGWHMPGDECPAQGVQNATFEQLIDHTKPELGTFSQFYYYDTRYWKGPGSPVVLFTPGEVNVTLYTNYLVNNRTTGVLAEKIGAATIVIEHRYWGKYTLRLPLRVAGLVG